MPQIQQKADFSFIRYSNCWEDADILLEALDTGKGKNLISIASSGDNSLALLLTDPALVVAVDLNLKQLACLELRVAAFKCLEYEDILKFLGFSEDKYRVQKYQKLRNYLPQEVREIWDNNIKLIRNGVIHSGKFERFFHTFRRYVLPFIHPNKRVRELLQKKSLEEQKQFYYDKWSNKRWNMLTGLFFGRSVTGKIGRDPEFFRFVEDDVSSNILKRTEYGLISLPTYTNPYLNYIMLGNFPIHALPVYLRKENHQKIKSNIDRITTYQGEFSQCLEKFSHIKFDGYNLSDIFEYMSPSEAKETFALIHKHSSSKARVAYWNLHVDRFVPRDLPFSILKDLSENLRLKDNTFFYKRFIVAET